MRELTYYIAVSLDGRIAGAGGDFSAFPVTGDHIEMIFDEYTDTIPGMGLEQIGRKADNSVFDTVLMGWSTYAASLPFGVVDPYPHLRQYVASSRPRDVPANITVTPDPVATVRELKAEPEGTGIWLCGGGVLASALIDEIDRLVLKVNPIVLGEGPALFEHPYGASAFTLTRSTPYASGVVINEYSR